MENPLERSVDERGDGDAARLCAVEDEAHGTIALRIERLLETCVGGRMLHLGPGDRRRCDEQRES